MTNNENVIRSRSELDTLLINIETAVRVKKRSDFFSWVQGVFQGLIGHEVLVCTIHDPRGRSYHMEWMSSLPIEDGVFARISEPGGLVYRLIEMWEQLGHEPLQIKPNCVQNDPRLLAEMDRLHLDDILAHGLPDLHGRTSTFFAFSRVTGGIKEQHRTALELVLPYLHAAWVRSQHEADREAREGTLVLAPEILTSRQVEILNWVQHGKSNSEIAQILNISHLTVKNHVQKILRKLNAQNRAQAVAKGISLNLTGGRTH